MKVKNTEERIKKFPPDRIPFLPSVVAAAKDKEVFFAYKEKRISLAMACRYVAENNGLTWVSREQFLAEYSFLGWDYLMTEEDNERLYEYGRDHGGAL